ncbi:Uncharacterised protein [Streptococcus pneumoniae]|nr:Uncharacterised protein [Streptococcus pneumoniae]
MLEVDCFHLSFSALFQLIPRDFHQDGIPLLIAFMAQYSCIRRFFPQILQLVSILFLNLSHDTLSLMTDKILHIKTSLPNLVKNLQTSLTDISDKTSPHAFHMNVRIEVTSLLVKDLKVHIISSDGHSHDKVTLQNLATICPDFAIFYKTIIMNLFLIKLIGFKNFKHK